MKIEKISPKQIERYRACISGEEFGAVAGKQSAALGCVWEDTPCGILTLSMGSALDGETGKNLSIDFFYVLPDYRGRGVFHTLVSSLSDYAKTRGAKGILTQTVFPEMETSEAALLAEGFSRISDGNKVYRIAAEDMAASTLLSWKMGNAEKNVCSLQELSAQERGGFFRSFGSVFPAELGPESIGGVLLTKLSFTLLVKGRVMGFLLSSRLPGNVLYVGSVYMKKEYSHATAILLKKFIEGALSDGGFESVQFAAASEAGERLAQRVLRDCTGEVDVQVVRNYYKDL